MFVDVEQRCCCCRSAAAAGAAGAATAVIVPSSQRPSRRNDHQFVEDLLLSAVLPHCCAYRPVVVPGIHRRGCAWDSPALYHACLLPVSYGLRCAFLLCGRSCTVRPTATARGTGKLETFCCKEVRWCCCWCLLCVYLDEADKVGAADWEDLGTGGCSHQRLPSMRHAGVALAITSHGSHETVLASQEQEGVHAGIDSGGTGGGLAAGPLERRST
jgi:hypothetical protein